MGKSRIHSFAWSANGTIDVHAATPAEAEEKAQHAITQLVTMDAGTVWVQESNING